ncbi:hypothetical protein V8G54_012075 [Vigna mungo]|uniref:Uncharacterized protein n=1 Tax=Vigna mungo TaxID=3915 RepID=A0AAQ3S3N8_VIGMU
MTSRNQPKLLNHFLFQAIWFEFAKNGVCFGIVCSKLRVIEMDFHGMKRKRLQALCKKHGIPANLKSCEMANRLSLLFKEKEMEYPVGSGNARTEKDTTLHCVGGKNVEMIDLVTPSPGSKERSVFSSNNLKGSEIERLEFETNFSPEITREDFGICGVGDMQSRPKKEHDNSQGGLHLAPVAVAVVEFNNQLSEGEDEKLGDNNNLIGDICEYEKRKAEAEEQGVHNSLRGSNMKDVNALHSSKEESGSPMMVEDEATEQGDCNSPQGSRMKDVKVLHVSQEESGYPVVEKDEAVEQGDQSSSPGSNMKDVNALHASVEESGSPMMEEDEAIDPGNCISTQGSSMKDVKIFHVSQEESGYPVMEKDEAEEQGDHNSPPGSNTKDVTVLHASEEECGFPMVEEDNALKQGDRNSSQGPSMKDVNILLLSQKVSDYPIAEDVAVEQGDNNSPQGPNIKDVNILHVYQEESLYPLVEEDVAVERGDHNSPQGPNIKDVNILDVYQEESLYPVVEEDVAVEQGDHISPQGPNFKDENILHVYQEESVYPVVEEDAAVEQGDHNSPQGPNIKDVNILHVYPEESVYPVVEEDASVEEGDHISPQGPNIKDVNILHVYREESVYSAVEEDVAVEQGDQNISQGPNMKEVNVLHVFLEESGYPVEEEEVVEQGDHNSPQGSNLKDVSVMHVSQEDFGFPTVEELQKAEGNICNGSVCDLLNAGSEVDAKNTDGKINLTAEHSVDDVPSSLNKSSVGTHDQFQSSYPENEVMSSGLNIHQDTCKEELKSPQNTGSIANPGECSRFSPHNLEASLVESFQFETYSESSPLGDIGTCDMKESMQSYKIQKVEYKPNATIEQFTDELQSSTFEDSDGTPVQFLSNDALSEVKTDFNEMVVSGIAFENVDMSEAKFVSSRKISLSPASDRRIDFSPKQLNNSETKVLQSETARIDVGIGEMENMQMDVNKELVDEVGDYYLLEGEIDKSGLIADSKECIGILPNNLLPSATKGFEDETYFDQSALGDVVETFKMEESMPSDQMEKEFRQKVLHMANDSVQEEITRLINNSDDHEYVGVTGPEDGKNQHNMKRDMESIEKYLLNDFYTLEDASGQNSDENAPTMPQEGEMKLCTFNHKQMSASGTFCGDEMETPPKCTSHKLRESFIKKELKILSSLPPVKRARDILGASDMKENIKISKKTPSRSALPKRKPLQHLQQN